MPDLKSPDSTSPPRPKHQILISAWDWLARPLVSRLTEKRRRTRLLAWMLLTILGLTTLAIFLVLMVNAPGSPRRGAYIPFILGLNTVLVIAYVLNSAGHYSLAAGLTVGCAALGPWGSLMLDPAILRGDFVPLGYTILSILLCSILLSALITAVLAALEFVAFVLLALNTPLSAALNWPSLLGLLFFAAVLSILSNIVTQSSLKEIHRQTRQLAQSEAEQRELSVRDHLTKLFNRRYLEETLAREIRRSVRSHHKIGIILFDVDQFKQVNDKWGHAAGDLLLQEIGGLAAHHTRGGDIACRYGGDEFVLVLPEASLQATRQRADRLRELVRRLQLEYDSHSLGTITISAGAAIYPEHGSSMEALLKSVDNALYRAKEAGRDRVLLAKKSS
jgi:diguanylate cyclase (GGDEF)-like protein